MELWIRSQDKELLVLAKGFELQNTSYNGGCQIFAVQQNNYQCVGNYKSKERALEVLDEINEILQLKLCSTLGTFEKAFDGYTEEQLRLVLKQMAVYEMPID